MNDFSPPPVRANIVPPPDLVARFAAVVGDRHAITDPGEIAPFVTEERGLYRGRSPLLLRPGSTAEVAAVCGLAAETDVAIVPQGGNTGLVGGQTAHHGEVILSLRRLDRIRDIDPASDTMTCEAGVILASAQAAASNADRLFPLSLGAEGSCTIGGNLSTNAGGVAALSYGVARDLALGLEVVLADGRVLNGLSKLKKDNTGYDLRNIFIGAEGTLGIITAAVLKMFPKPRSYETALVGLASPEAALKLLRLARAEAGPALTSFELIAEICIDFSVRHGPGIRSPLAGRHPWYVLMEVSSSREGGGGTVERILEAALERDLVSDAVLAASETQRRQLWTLREMISGIQKHEGGSIKHDVSVPVAAVPDFIAAAGEAVRALLPGARPVAFGHLGDGNIHYNVSQPAGENLGPDKERFLARWHEVQRAVHDIVVRFGGSISAEHGVGVMKREEVRAIKDPVSYDVMRLLKASLDPKGIMNPGKVI